MTWKTFCPALALLSGGISFFLRRWQDSAAFDGTTGLPVPGAVAGWLLPLFLLLCAGGFFLVTRGLSLPGSPKAPLLLLGDGLATVAVFFGVLLLAFSGGMELTEGLSTAQRPLLAVGLLSLLSAAALLPLLPSCKRGGVLNGTLLLFPAIFTTLRLVLFYRAYSSNPVLSAYYVEILAMAALILAYFQLASFWFQNGKASRFALWAMVGAVLNLCAGADFLHQPAQLSYFAGSALLLLGFLRLCLGNAKPRRKALPAQV